MISDDVSIFSPVRAGSTFGFPVIMLACEPNQRSEQVHGTQGQLDRARRFVEINPTKGHRSLSGQQTARAWGFRRKFSLRVSSERSFMQCSLQMEFIATWSNFFAPGFSSDMAAG